MNAVLYAAIAMPVLFGAALAAISIAERRRAALRRRIHERIALSGPGTGTAPLVLDMTTKQRAARSARWLPAAFGEWLAAELSATGDRLSVGHLIGAGILGGTIGIVLGETLLSIDRTFSWTVGAALALAAPLFLLRQMQQRFEGRFLDGFPDALDLMVRAVRAGLPVIDALDAVGTELSEPVGPEFRRIHDAVSIGIDLEESLTRASMRIRLVEFRFFIAAVALQRQTGGNLAEAMHNLSTVIRRRREMRLKARALTSETRASAWLIGVLPFIAGAALYAISPDYIEKLLVDPRGHVLVGIASASLAFGAVIMRSLVKQAGR